MMLSCDTCRFWVRLYGEKTEGHCRRYAPRAVTVLGSDPVVRRLAIFPRTFETDWCGEHDTVRLPAIKTDDFLNLFGYSIALIFKRRGLRTMAQLREIDDKGFLAMRNLGKAKLFAIKAVLDDENCAVQQ